MTGLRVLIGCEESGIVRRAFAARGHDAWSCDFEPAADGSNRHYRCDVREVMHLGWDLAIFHPPCTRICNSGVRWLEDPRCKCPTEATADEKRIWPALGIADRVVIMQRLLAEAAALFSDVIHAPIDRIVIENPVMHKHAKALIKGYRAADQTVQPWWFGDPAFKATGLYLKNLPRLTATNRLTPPKRGTDEHKRWSAIHRASPGPNRARDRSRTFPGVAEAMADQLGGYAMGVAA